MRMTLGHVVSMGVAGVLAACISVAAQQKTPDLPSAPKLSPELQKMLDAQEKASQPGPEHVNLMRLAGDYTTKQKISGPGQTTPLESDGTAQLRSEMGGRFIVEHNTGGSMGEPYTGVRIYGFNNGTKKYEGVWMYAGSTAVMSLVGESPDGGTTIHYTATFRSDTTGQELTMQITLQILDTDHFQVDATHKMPDGSPGPRFVTVYTRAKLPEGS